MRRTVRGRFAGAVIDDRTAAYNGAGFYIPDSVTVELAPVTYTSRER